MQVAAIMFLLLIRLQFPKSKSISDTLDGKYRVHLIIVHVELNWISNSYYVV